MLDPVRVAVFIAGLALLAAAVSVAQSQPTSAPSTPSVEVEVQATARALFYVLYIDPTTTSDEVEWRLAVPIACVGESGGWIADASACLAGLSEGAAPVDRNGRRYALAGTGRDEMYEYEGRLMAADGFDWGLVATGTERLPTFPCPETDELSALTALPIATESLTRYPVVADPANGVLLEVLQNGPLDWSGARQADFDGDGSVDTWFSFGLHPDEPLGPCESLYGLYARWGHSPESLTLIDLACEAWPPDPSWGTSTRLGEHYLESSTCYDLDGNRVPEVMFAIGGETERVYDYVTWHEGKLRDVGPGIGLGD